jgi:cytochrome c556
VAQHAFLPYLRRPLTKPEKELAMKRRNAILLGCTAAVALGAVLGSAYAQGQPTPAEKLLKYRKSVYQVILWNFGPLSAMAQDKQPFDAAVFAERAQRVAQLTPMLAESYVPESRGAEGSRLKPEMWSNRADFDAKLSTLVDRSAALAKTAQGGDPAASKAAFFETAKACSACHDKYRAD